MSSFVDDPDLYGRQKPKGSRVAKEELIEQHPGAVSVDGQPQDGRSAAERFLAVAYNVADADATVNNHRDPKTFANPFDDLAKAQDDLRQFGEEVAVRHFESAFDKARRIDQSAVHADRMENWKALRTLDQQIYQQQAAGSDPYELQSLYQQRQRHELKERWLYHLHMLPATVLANRGLMLIGSGDPAKMQEGEQWIEKARGLRNEIDQDQDFLAMHRQAYLEAQMMGAYQPRHPAFRQEDPFDPGGDPFVPGGPAGINPFLPGKDDGQLPVRKRSEMPPRDEGGEPGRSGGDTKKKPGNDGGEPDDAEKKKKAKSDVGDPEAEGDGPPGFLPRGGKTEAKETRKVPTVAIDSQEKKEKQDDEVPEPSFIQRHIGQATVATVLGSLLIRHLYKRRKAAQEKEFQASHDEFKANSEKGSEYTRARKVTVEDRDGGKKVSFEDGRSESFNEAEFAKRFQERNGEYFDLKDPRYVRAWEIESDRTVVLAPGKRVAARAGDLIIQGDDGNLEHVAKDKVSERLLPIPADEARARHDARAVRLQAIHDMGGTKGVHYDLFFRAGDTSSPGLRVSKPVAKDGPGTIKEGARIMVNDGTAGGSLVELQEGDRIVQLPDGEIRVSKKAAAEFDGSNEYRPYYSETESATISGDVTLKAEAAAKVKYGELAVRAQNGRPGLDFQVLYEGGERSKPVKLIQIDTAGDMIIPGTDGQPKKVTAAEGDCLIISKDSVRLIKPEDLSGYQDEEGVKKLESEASATKSEQLKGALNDKTKTTEFYRYGDKTSPVVVATNEGVVKAGDKVTIDGKEFVCQDGDRLVLENGKITLARKAEFSGEAPSYFDKATSETMDAAAVETARQKARFAESARTLDKSQPDAHERFYEWGDVGREPVRATKPVNATDPASPFKPGETILIDGKPVVCSEGGRLVFKDGKYDFLPGEKFGGEGKQFVDAQTSEKISIELRAGDAFLRKLPAEGEEFTSDDGKDSRRILRSTDRVRIRQKDGSHKVVEPGQFVALSSTAGGDTLEIGADKTALSGGLKSTEQRQREAFQSECMRVQSEGVEWTYQDGTLCKAGKLKATVRTQVDGKDVVHNPGDYLVVTANDGRGVNVYKSEEEIAANDFTKGDAKKLAAEKAAGAERAAGEREVERAKAEGQQYFSQDGKREYKVIELKDAVLVKGATGEMRVSGGQFLAVPVDGQDEVCLEFVNKGTVEKTLDTAEKKQSRERRADQQKERREQLEAGKREVERLKGTDAHEYLSTDGKNRPARVMEIRENKALFSNPNGMLVAGSKGQWVLEIDTAKGKAYSVFDTRDDIKRYEPKAAVLENQAREEARDTEKREREAAEHEAGEWKERNLAQIRVLREKGKVYFDPVNGGMAKGVQLEGDCKFTNPDGSVSEGSKGKFLVITSENGKYRFNIFENVDAVDAKYKTGSIHVDRLTGTPARVIQLEGNAKFANADGSVVEGGAGKYVVVTSVNGQPHYKILDDGEAIKESYWTEAEFRAFEQRRLTAGNEELARLKKEGTRYNSKDGGETVTVLQLQKEIFLDPPSPSGQQKAPRLAGSASDYLVMVEKDGQTSFEVVSGSAKDKQAKLEARLNGYDKQSTTAASGGAGPTPDKVEVGAKELLEQLQEKMNKGQGEVWCQRNDPKEKVDLVERIAPGVAILDPKTNKVSAANEARFLVREGRPDFGAQGWRLVTEKEYTQADGKEPQKLALQRQQGERNANAVEGVLWGDIEKSDYTVEKYQRKSGGAEVSVVKLKAGQDTRTYTFEGQPNGGPLSADVYVVLDRGYIEWLSPAEFEKEYKAPERAPVGAPGERKATEGDTKSAERYKDHPGAGYLDITFEHQSGKNKFKYSVIGGEAESGFYLIDEACVKDLWRFQKLDAKEQLKEADHKQERTFLQTYPERVLVSLPSEDGSRQLAELFTDGKRYFQVVKRTGNNQQEWHYREVNVKFASRPAEGAAPNSHPLYRGVMANGGEKVASEQRERVKGLLTDSVTAVATPEGVRMPAGLRAPVKSPHGGMDYMFESPLIIASERGSLKVVGINETSTQKAPGLIVEIDGKRYVDTTLSARIHGALSESYKKGKHSELYNADANHRGRVAAMANCVVGMSERSQPILTAGVDGGTGTAGGDELADQQLLAQYLGGELSKFQDQLKTIVTVTQGQVLDSKGQPAEVRAVQLKTAQEWKDWMEGISKKLAEGGDQTKIDKWKELRERTEKLLGSADGPAAVEAYNELYRMGYGYAFEQGTDHAILSEDRMVLTRKPGEGAKPARGEGLSKAKAGLVGLLILCAAFGLATEAESRGRTFPKG